MMSRCQEMIAQQQEMTERKKRTNEKLAALVRDINRAKSEEPLAGNAAFAIEPATVLDLIDGPLPISVRTCP